MNSGLNLTILTPERRLVEGVRVEEVTLTGSEGQIQVLPGHAPMIGTLRTGAFGYLTAGKPPVEGFISCGFFEIREDQIYVMAETLELKGEIDVHRARKAQQRSEETLKVADLDEHQFKKYQLKLQRALIRQQMGGGEGGGGA